MAGPKLKDIAKIARVSVPTVSLVLSGKGRISSEVRERIMKVAGDLGYLQSQYKTKKAEHSNRNIGLLYSFEANWSHVHGFLAPMVTMIEELLESNDHYLSIIALTRDLSTDNLFERILRDDLKAVLSIHYVDEVLFHRLEKLGVPVVVINNLEFQDVFYTAGVDDFQGSYEATKYLIDLGHRRIAYLDYPRDDLPTLMNRRHLGYRTALEEAGIQVDNSYHVRTAVTDAALIAEKIGTLMALQQPPTALFAHDDFYMMHVIHAINALGIRIPDDISAVAHGDTLDYSRVYIPQLTTMRINTAQLGKLACEMLINRLNHQPDDIHVVKLKEQLLDRGSCLPPG